MELNKALLKRNKETLLNFYLKEANPDEFTCGTLHKTHAQHSDVMRVHKQLLNLFCKRQSFPMTNMINPFQFSPNQEIYVRWRFWLRNTHPNYIASCIRAKFIKWCINYLRNI